MIGPAMGLLTAGVTGALCWGGQCWGQGVILSSRLPACCAVTPALCVAHTVGRCNLGVQRAPSRDRTAIRGLGVACLLCALCLGQWLVTHQVCILARTTRQQDWGCLPVQQTVQVLLVVCCLGLGVQWVPLVAVLGR